MDTEDASLTELRGRRVDVEVNAGGSGGGSPSFSRRFAALPWPVGGGLGHHVDLKLLRYPVPTGLSRTRRRRESVASASPSRRRIPVVVVLVVHEGLVAAAAATDAAAASASSAPLLLHALFLHPDRPGGARFVRAREEGAGGSGENVTIGFSPSQSQKRHVSGLQGTHRTDPSVNFCPEADHGFAAVKRAGHRA